MAGRPFWSGQLRISLVSFGIQLFPATSATSEISFHQIDRKTRQRVHHLNVINGDEPVDNSDIVKGYEYSKGKYVSSNRTKSKSFASKRRSTINVAQFVDAKDLPPCAFRKTLLRRSRSQGDPSRPSRSFAPPCSQADKVAIGEVAFGGREHLIAIAPAPGKTRAV